MRSLICSESSRCVLLFSATSNNNFPFLKYTLRATPFVRHFGGPGVRPQTYIKSWGPFYSWAYYRPPRFIRRLRYRYPRIGLVLTFFLSIFAAFPYFWKDLYNLFDLTPEQFEAYRQIRKIETNEWIRYGTGGMYLPFRLEPIELWTEDQVEYMRNRNEIRHNRMETYFENLFQKNIDFVAREFGKERLKKGE